MMWISILCMGAMLAGWILLRRVVRMRYCRLRGAAAAGALALVLAGAAGVFLAWTGLLAPRGMSESGRDRLLRAQALKIGRAIVGESPGQPVVLVCAADQAGSDRIGLLRQILDEELGLRTRVLPVDFRRPPARSDDDAGLSLAAQLSSRDYDAALTETAGDEVLIFAVNLPGDYGRMKLWKQRRRPPVYLMDIAAPERFLEAVDRGWVTAMTANHPGADYDDVAVSRNPETAFDRRYLWIDAGNCRQLW